MFHRSAEDAPPATQSQRLGNFTLTSLISSGALTTVHHARGALAQDANAECVIKRLQPKYANDPELRSVLLASGQIGLKVSSPRVVRTLAVLEEPEPFVVLEYLNGVSLHELVTPGPSSTGWSPEVARYAVPVLVDVLSGLHAMHSAGGREGTPTGWVHGAPSARHIMVMPDGSGRLVDLTQVVGPGLAWAPRRDAFLIAEEMAPEQALAPAHVDARCDLFIVGSVLWHMLTGKAPFAAEGTDAALRNMLRTSIPAPSEVRPTVGRALDGVCMQALQRPRQARYASASEMATVLREKAEQAGLWASREEIAAWASRTGEKPPAPTPGTALATRATVIGIGFNEIQDQAAGGTAPFRPSRPRRAHGEHGGQRPHVASSLPALRRPVVAAPAPAAATEPFFAATNPTSGVTPTAGNQESPIKPEDSFVYRRTPEMAALPAALPGPALPGPETYARAMPSSPPWHDVQPSVAPPRESQPAPGLFNKKAVAAGSAAAVVVLLIALAIDDELGAPRRPPEMVRHGERSQLVPAAVTPPSMPAPVPATPPSTTLPSATLPSSPEPAPVVENNTLEALMRSTGGRTDDAPPAAAAPAPAGPTSPSAAPAAEKRPSAPRVERAVTAPAPAEPAWGAGPSVPWDFVEKPKKRGSARSGETDSLPRNPY